MPRRTLAAKRKKFCILVMCSKVEKDFSPVGSLFKDILIEHLLYGLQISASR